jgi:hypothetical protein
LDAPQAWEMWKDLRDQGLGQYRDPPNVVFEGELRRVFKIFIGGLIALGVGLATTLAPMFLPGKPRSPQGR